MADLVRVRLDGFEKNVGASFAESHDLEVIDEPTHRGDGTVRPTLRAGGRRVKPKTTVDAEAKKKPAPKKVAEPKVEESPES